MCSRVATEILLQMMRLNEVPSSALDIEGINLPSMMSSTAIFNSAEWPSTPCLEDLINDPYSTVPVVMETGADSSALVTAHSHMASDTICLKKSNNRFETPPDECSSSTIQPTAASPFSWDPNLEAEQIMITDSLHPGSPEMYPHILAYPQDELDPCFQNSNPPTLDKCAEENFLIINPDECLVLKDAVETCPSPQELDREVTKLPILDPADLAHLLGEPLPTKALPIPLVDGPKDTTDYKDSTAKTTQTKEDAKMTLKKVIKNRRRAKGMTDIVLEVKKPMKEELTEADCIRLSRRQASNRKAAAKCRQKRKEQETELHQKKDQLERENVALRREIIFEKQKVKKLEDTINEHKATCPLHNFV